MITKQKVYTNTGEILELLPVGTRIHHKDHPKLTGKIVGWEYHERGGISPLPYKVYWDNPALALELIGWFTIYPGVDKVVPLGP